MSVLLETIRKIDSAKHCIITQNEIEITLDRLGAEVTRDFSDKNPLILCVMIGALVPTADLIKRLNFPLQIDYIHATRYHGAVTGGSLQWLMEPRVSLEGRHVLIVEDILDKGVTLAEIIRYCISKKAASVATLAFIDKKTPRAEGALAHADYTGIAVEDRFVIGYGLDYEEYFRNLQGIYTVEGIAALL